ncbi:MAG TPA: hypothetical protein VKM55_19355 [Candidatus Lokiarchaeia archaeon]|nr:hypothetical protein [Candidatus Lokiarchaeia archaeon]
MTRKSIDVPSETTFYVRILAITCAICGGTWSFGLASMMWQHPNIFTVEPWYELAIGVLVCAGSAYGYLLSDHRVSAIILTPVGVFIIAEMIYNVYLANFRAFGAWEFFAVIQTIYGLVILAGAAVLIIHIIRVSIYRFKITIAAPEMRGRDVAGRHLRKFKPLHVVLLIAIVGSGVISQALSNNWFIPQNASVTLHPGNYVAKFQFYGLATYINYSSAERNELNNLGVRIIAGVTDFVSYTDYKNAPFTWWMNLTDYKKTTDYQTKRQRIIDTFMPWKVNNYSRITFLYWLGGVPSGLPTDYSVSDGYWGVGALMLNAWLTAQVIVEANLTNVVGFHTDQESVDKKYQPVGGALNQSFQDQRSFDRSEQAADNYRSFFQRLQYEEQTNQTWINFDGNMSKLYGVDHLLFTTTYGGPTVVAGLGGKDALVSMDVFTEDVVNTVPYDQYLPMLYNQGQFPPDRAHYDLYMQLQWLKTTLGVDGYSNPENRIGVLLGCMGGRGSLFLPNYTGPEFVNGSEQQVTGFEVIARQVEIAKCFNCSWISFFPFNPYLPDIYGINSTFGDTFLDHLNATVNGANATRPFQIKFYPSAGASDTDLARTVFMSDAWAWFYLAGLIVAIALPCVHAVIAKRRSAAH